MPGFLAILVGMSATVGFILIFAASNYRRVRLWRAIGSFLLGFPLGVLSYGWLGIHMAHAHGTRFYSWPFGESKMGHSAVGLSVLFWVATWFIVLFGGSSLLSKSSSPDRHG